MRQILIVILLQALYFTSSGQIENYKLYNVNRDDGLLSNHVETVFQDSYGFIWLATYEGLARWDGHSFKKYQHSDNDSTSIPHNISYCIFEDSKKRLWVGTIDGLILYDREKDNFIKCVLSNDSQRTPVNVIKEDSKHQLWLGTSWGLCKYNYEKRKGEWYYHDSKNKNSLSDNVIFGLAIDRNDDIWIGTFNGGVNRFSTNTKTATRFLSIPSDDHTICSNKVKTIFVDNKDYIWVGSFDKGISVINPQGKVSHHYGKFSNREISKGPENVILCIYQDKKNNIWAGIEGEYVHFLDKEKDRFVPFPKTPYKKIGIHCVSVASLFEDNSGDLWFASHRNGLFYTNEYKNIFRHYYKDPSVSNGLTDNAINCLFEDKKGNIWIGTHGGGLHLFDKGNKIISLKILHELDNRAIYDIKEDNQNNLWLATWGRGLIRFNPVNKSSQTFIHDPGDKSSIVYNNINTILIDDSLIWIGTHGEGLVVFNLKNKKFIHHQNNTIFNFDMKEPAWINHLFKDSKNRIWISTYGGLFLYDHRKLTSFIHSKAQTSISSNDINMVMEDSRGRIWIGSESGGLDLYNEQKSNFIRYSNRVASVQVVKSIVEDDKGNLWLSSNEGLISFNPSNKSWKRYNAEDGLQGNFFSRRSGLKSRLGELYFGGPDGFNVFHPDSIKINLSPTNFYLKDLFVFDELQKPQPHHVALKKVISLTDTLTLSYDQSFFTLNFAEINLYSPTKTQYVYKLEGLHRKWINAQSDGRASFTNLAPGTYFFKVKYSGIMGEWLEADKKLCIVILPPWWKTWWFKGLLSISSVSIMMLMFYLRLFNINKRNKELESEVIKRTTQLTEVNSYLQERNEEINFQNEQLEHYYKETVKQSDMILKQQEDIVDKNQELEKTVEKLKVLNKTKDRFFSILAHDLKNPIYALSNTTDLLKKKLSGSNDQEIYNLTSDINKSSKTVYDLLLNLLEWARTQSGNKQYSPTGLNVYDLISKNAFLIEQQLINKKIKLTTHIEEAHSIYADFNMIDAVIRNLLSNSLKFTNEGGNIFIESKCVDNEIVITIRDTGVGISTDQIDNLFNDQKNLTNGTAGETGTGLGLSIVKDFVEINKGRIEVESEKDKGATFTVRLPKSHISEPSSLKNNYKPEKEAVYGANAFKEFPVETCMKENFINKNENYQQVPDDRFDTIRFSEEKLEKIKGKKILIVDDSPEVRNYLVQMLSETFIVFEAENGEQGIKAAIEEQPEIIISDMMMPVMDGIEFCKSLKRNRLVCHIPVILLTAQTHEEGQLPGYEAGADIYLEKPVQQNLLMQVVFNLIQNQEVMRQKYSHSDEIYPTNLSINKLDEEFLDKVINFIEQYLSDKDLDSKKICQHTAMSRTVLYAKIKAITGQGVHDFIKSIRLKKAIKLLFDERLNVSQIAYEVGFSSPSYFIRCFVKEYKMSPKEYLTNKKMNKVNAL